MVVEHQEECQMVCAAGSAVGGAAGRRKLRRKARSQMDGVQKLAVLVMSSRRG